MKLKFASSKKRRKGSKIQISGVTMVLYLTSKDFTLCLHLLHLNLIIVNLELIDISVWFSTHSTTLPVIFFPPCSHVYKPFAVLKSFFLKKFRIRQLTTTSLTPDSSKIIFTTAAVADS